MSFPAKQSDAVVGLLEAGLRKAATEVMIRRRVVAPEAAGAVECFRATFVMASAKENSLAPAGADGKTDRLDPPPAGRMSVEPARGRQVPRRIPERRNLMRLPMLSEGAGDLNKEFPMALNSRAVPRRL